MPDNRKRNRDNPGNTEAIGIRVCLWLLLCSAGCSSLGPEDLARLEITTGNGQTKTAGDALDIPPAVKAVDEKGSPIRGVSVTFSVLAGDGSVTGGTAMSDKEGIATVGSWVLGPLIGENVLGVSAPLAPEVRFTATGVTGPPTIVEKIEGDDQVATAGRPVPTQPRMRLTDKGGNPVGRRNISIEVVSGNGEIREPLTTTDDDGFATVLSWTLGVVPGTNTLTATVDAATATFTVTGISGPVAIAIAAGDSQTVIAGADVPVQPRVVVTDAQDLVVPGADVVFGIAGGGGGVSSDTVRTNSNGVARVSWTLGTTAGGNSLAAEVSDVGVVVFTATGVPGPASKLAVFSGDKQFGAIDSDLPAPPAALVTDQFDNPVEGVDVDFAVASGGGTVAGSPATSDSDGVAAASAWTLGPAEIENTVVASIAGGATATFTATALAEVFDIDIVRIGGAGPRFSEALDVAKARWRQMIIGDLPDVSFADDSLEADACGNPDAFGGVVDDVRVYVVVEAIDGPGSILGAAGPCFIRDEGGIPVVGGMTIDLDDVPGLVDRGLLDDVILHEFGHILGIGSLWDDFGYLQNPSLPSSEGADTHFNGPRAVAAFDDIGGTSFGGSKVPVENRQGGPGTRDVHWREATLNSEAMTGFINEGRNPMSIVSVESLGDMGYVVNALSADAYVLPGSAAAQVVTGDTPRIEMVNDVWIRPIYVVNRQGRITAVIPR